MPLEVRPRWVPATSVIVFLARAALECGGLVDGSAARVELVVAFGVDQLGGESILAAVRRAGRRGRRGQIVTVEVKASHGFANGTGRVFRSGHGESGYWGEVVF